MSKIDLIYAKRPFIRGPCKRAPVYNLHFRWAEWPWFAKWIRKRIEYRSKSKEGKLYMKSGQRGVGYRMRVMEGKNVQRRHNWGGRFPSFHPRRRSDQEQENNVWMDLQRQKMWAAQHTRPTTLDRSSGLWLDQANLNQFVIKSVHIWLIGLDYLRCR